MAPGVLTTVGMELVSRTTDGGASWMTVDAVMVIHNSRFYRNVSFRTADEGWVVGDGGWIRYTTDAGLTWWNMDYPSGYSLQTVAAAAPGGRTSAARTASSCAMTRAPLAPPSSRAEPRWPRLPWGSRSPPVALSPLAAGCGPASPDVDRCPGRGRRQRVHEPSVACASIDAAGDKSRGR